MTRFECACGCKFSHEGSVTIRIRGERVRSYDENDQPVDICPECGNIAEEVRDFKGWATNWSKTKGGVVGGDWSGSASK
jgi:hypothetical protein